ncbi:hypothetical protein TNCV_3157601 [Trichonephila clavipes]|nr:hypothetical protein TNCV_3157601 [Trichonephila clavipes]
MPATNPGIASEVRFALLFCEYHCTYKQMVLLASKRHISSIQEQKLHNPPCNDFGSGVEAIRHDAFVHEDDNIACVDNFKNLSPGITVKIEANNKRR